MPTEEVKAKISAFGFASTKDLDKKTYDLVCEWAENYDNPDNFTMPEEGMMMQDCPLDLTRLENYPCSRGDCDCEICKEQEKGGITMDKLKPCPFCGGSRTVCG